MLTQRVLSLGVIVCLPLVVTLPAEGVGSLADDADDAALPAATDELEVRITTGAWLARLGGDARLRQSPSTKLNFTEDLDLRDMEATLNAELTITKHDTFQLHMGGFSFETANSGTYEGSAVFGDISLNDGDDYRASFDMTSVSAELRFALYKPYEENGGINNTDGKRRLRFRVSPLIGARYLDVEQRLERVGGNSERVGGEWLGIYGGFNVELMFRPDQNRSWFDRMSLHTAAAIGPAIGGDGGFMWQVQAGMHVHFTENLGAIVGYRLVELDVENDGYELVGGLQGLFLAGTLRF